MVKLGSSSVVKKRAHAIFKVQREKEKEPNQYCYMVIFSHTVTDCDAITIQSNLNEQIWLKTHFISAEK